MTDTATDAATDATAGRLLRQIAERPADDAPRLVYADWLEDHGDTARAWWLRFWCGPAKAAAERAVARAKPADTLAWPWPRLKEKHKLAAVALDLMFDLMPAGDMDPRSRRASVAAVLRWLGLIDEKEMDAAWQQADAAWQQADAARRQADSAWWQANGQISALWRAVVGCYRRERRHD